MKDSVSGPATPRFNFNADGNGATRAVLVLGDCISFLVFAAIGRSSHGEAAGFGALLEVVKTAAPFLLGWFLAAPWLGAYRLTPLPAIDRRATNANPLMPFIKRTALAWVVAWPIGLGLRALFLQRGIPLSFAIIVFLTNTVLLVGWRSFFAWGVLGRRPDTDQAV